ncbi:putative transporter [Cyphellophora attinorum]|uniref:Putative transporter n=1 Tax=Cyphellophora attinorum TaxID=1664694 RepID=A0A0N1H718_9EURO|nr:putative transporter [Phialophora attinorum]KPI38653.1 putative transporter [Phialophora attinorum]
MSPPEMRENRPLLDTPASVGTFAQPTAGEVAEVTERTALLTKKEQHSEGHKKDAHFRNIDGRGFWILFSTIIFGNIIAFFDGTLMASAHPVITSYFHASNSASWLSTVFFLTLTVTQPLYGRVSDIIGRRKVYIFAEILFLVATVWCGVAPTMGHFIAARALCGMGAGGVTSVSSMITSDVVKIEYRGIYQSYYNMAYALGNGLGAAFGGMLCDTLGWRMAFFIQIPWIMIFLVATCIVTPDDLGPNLAKAQGKTVWQAFETFDFQGSAVVTITVTSLILGINLGGNVLSWTHPFVISCLILTIVGGFSIAPVSRRAKRPVLPLHLLAKSPNSNLMWASLFFCICLNIVLFNVPLFLQAVRQTSPTVSGMYLVVPLVGVGLTSIFTGYFIAITRHMQPQLYVGQALLVIGVIGTIFLNQHMPTWAMLLVVPWVNIGQGFYFPTTTIATLSLNTLEDQAVVVSTLGLFRCIGSILGVAVSSWILQNSLPFYLERMVKDADPAIKEKIVQAVRGSVEAIRDLDPIHKGQVITAYAKAMRITFASG